MVYVRYDSYINETCPWTKLSFSIICCIVGVVSSFSFSVISFYSFLGTDDGQKELESIS